MRNAKPNNTNMFGIGPCKFKSLPTSIWGGGPHLTSLLLSSIYRLAYLLNVSLMGLPKNLFYMSMCLSSINLSILQLPQMLFLLVNHTHTRSPPNITSLTYLPLNYPVLSNVFLHLVNRIHHFCHEKGSPTLCLHTNTIL